VQAQPSQTERRARSFSTKHALSQVGSLVEASDDAGADAGAEAADTHEDPGDDEVGPHEVAGIGLVERAIFGELSLPSGVSQSGGGLDVAGGEAARLTQSPDEAHNVPDLARALHAAEKTSAAHGEGGHASSGDTGTEAEKAGEGGVDEAPGEPGDEDTVHVDDVGGRVGGGLSGEELGGGRGSTCSSAGDDAVPGLLVGVAEGEDSQINDEGEHDGAAQQRGGAGTHNGALSHGHDGAETTRHFLEVVVHSGESLFETFNYKSCQLRYANITVRARKINICAIR